MKYAMMKTSMCSMECPPRVFECACVEGETSEGKACDNCPGGRIVPHSPAKFICSGWKLMMPPAKSGTVWNWWLFKEEL
jgi:hypothetical protein